MKKALVLGFGVSGRAAAKLLHKRGYSVIAYDDEAFKPDVHFDYSSIPFIEKTLCNVQDLYLLKDIELLLLSPGIASSHPVLKWAEENHIAVIGEVEYALQGCQNRCIGITGTNGKTTVTLLTEYVLKKLGYKAVAIGNVGYAVSEYFLNPDPTEILVIELSSFQIETFNAKSLDAAVILNISPDHLDRYPTYGDYARAKFKLGLNMKPGRVCFLLQETYDQFLDIAKEYPLQILTLQDKRELISSLKEQHRVFFLGKAPYEQENFMFTALALREVGVSFEEFFEIAKDFTRPNHRIEFVKQIEGIYYFNDSKATNIDATIKAVESMQGPVVLIAGGVHKGASYEIWKDKFKGKVKKIIVIGKAQDIIYEEMKNDYPVEKAISLKEAIDKASYRANPGDNVLLSPGCSSFDMFRNYADRGDQFKQLVNLQEGIHKS